MANEVLWSGIKSESERPQILAEILGIQTDQYYITNHPAIMDLGDVAGTNSDTKKIREDDLNGNAVMTSISEDSTWANSAYTPNMLEVAVGEYYDNYELSDTAAMVQDGQLDPARFAASMMRKRALTFTSLLATAVATFTNTQDAGAGSPTLEDFMDARHKLELLLNDPSQIAIAVLKPSVALALQKDATFNQQMNNAKDDPGVQAMSRMFGGAYRGRVFNTDIFVTPKVATASSKYQNGLFVRGAILTARGTPAQQLADQVLLGDVLFEKQRGAGNTTFTRSTTFMGVGVGQQTAGVLWTTAV